MWTPKRIGLLMIGNVLFSLCYLGYARSHLGTIDGLPALPEEMRRKEQGHIDPPPPRQSRVDGKLTQSFGPECKELKHPIKLELNSRSMVIAAGQAVFEKDGRVYLKPLSVALFGRDRNDGREVEINTITGDEAYLTFDRPVYGLQDINGRKIVAAELIGNIDIINNRRTSKRRDDDLVLHINHGPLYFEDAKHLIWTADRISVLDLQSTPKPMQVRGKGMDVELLVDAPAPSRGLRPARGRATTSPALRTSRCTATSKCTCTSMPMAPGMPGGDHGPKKAAAGLIGSARLDGRFRRREGPGRHQNPRPLPLRVQQGPR